MTDTLLGGYVGDGQFTTTSTAFASPNNVIAYFTESNSVFIIRSSGTLSNMWLRVTLNTKAQSLTVSSRINSAAGNQSVSINSQQTGTFNDTINQDILSAGDTLDVRFPFTVTGNFHASLQFFTFTADTNTVTKNGVSNKPFFLYVSPSLTFYTQPIGIMETSNTSEADAKMRIRKPFTIKNLMVKVFSNSSANASTVTSRKNGLDGNLTKSIPSAQTGNFEDTTHSDSVVAGDDYNFKYVTGAGSVNIDIDDIIADYISTAGDGILSLGDDQDVIVGISTTNYWGLNTDISSPVTTESQAQQQVNSAYTFSELTVRVMINGNTASSTLTLRANGGSSGVSLSIASSQTGVISDSTHTYSSVATDLMNHQLVTGSTGSSMFISHISVYTGAVIVAGVTTFAQNFKNILPSPKDWQLLQYQTNEPVFGI